MDLTDLLPAINACALAPEQWPQALELIIDFLGGNGATLFSVEATPEAKGLWANARLDPEAINAYVRYYRQIDPWYHAVYSRGLVIPGAAYTGDMLVPTEQLQETEYYRDFLLPFDNVDLLLTIFHDGAQPPVPTVALSVYRGATDPPFGAADIARIQPLIPVLQLATAVNFQLADRDRRLEVQGSALDVLGPALVLLNRSGEIVDSTRAAQALLAQEDGLTVRHARLWAADRVTQQLLDVLVADPESAAPEGVIRVPRPSGRRPFVAVRVAVPAERGGARDARRPSCALVLHDPDAGPGCNSAALRALYGLTAAELRVAESLVGIGTPAEIAAYLGSSEHTVRTQIKAIFRKTGTNRQADLVRVLLSVPTLG